MFYTSFSILTDFVTFDNKILKVYNEIRIMKDKLLTIKEVAKYLRVSERSVLRYIEAGRLKASKVGWWRVKEKDLEQFFQNNSNVLKRKR